MSTENQTPTELGWDRLKSLKEKAYSVIDQALENGTLRDKLQAASMVKSMDDTNLKLAEFEDKKERLDSGKPTEISDFSTLGAAASDLANRIGSVVGNRAGADQTTVRVVEGSEAEVRRLPDRAEPGDTDDEATEGA